MQHEEIIKRQDGAQYRIRVRLHVDSYSEIFEYRIDVMYKPKRKRTWLQLPQELSDWEYRSLSLEDRRKATHKNYVKFVSQEEIDNVKMILWQKLKPC